MLWPLLGDIDLVLVMSVNPGFGGQSFIESQLARIETIRKRIDAEGLDVELEVDGGINFDTAPRAIAAGATVLVAGTATSERRALRLCKEHRGTARRLEKDARQRKAAGDGRSANEIRTEWCAAGRMAAPSGNRAIDLAGAALVRMRDAGLARAFDTWAYGQSLRGPMPDHMVLYPPELRPGRASAADALFQGRWFLPGGQVRAPGGSSPFAADPPSETWAEELHGFSWLRHFTAAHAANNGDTAQRYAQKLVADWIETEGNWHDIAWRPQVIGRRLTSWVANGALIIDGTELVYRSTPAPLRRCAGHLARVAAIAPAATNRASRRRWASPFPGSASPKATSG